MSDLRAAAIQALGAMYEVNVTGGDVTNYFLGDAILALEEALSNTEPLAQATNISLPSQDS